MNKQELKTYLEQTFPSNKVEETFDFPLMFIDKSELLAVVQQLKDSKETFFDFLFCQTAIDRNPNFEVVYHLTSTTYRHDMVLKVVLEDRVNPEFEPLCRILVNYWSSGSPSVEPFTYQPNEIQYR